MKPELIDLMHQSRARVIGAWVVDDVIVDPGPASTLDALLGALDGRVPRVLALTHIHLDHAGASGSLVRRFPDLEVWVHERGAPHIVDPSKLLESAGRLYGEEMRTLWGDVLPVPQERLRVLRGGETIGPWGVTYTPGHASHHVCYLHEPSGTLFSGDVAGVRIGAGPVLAPTPPPDIDLDAWRASLSAVEGLRPRTLALTHHGAFEDVERHLRELREELDRVEALAGELDEQGFSDAIRARVGASSDAATAASYMQATRPGQGYLGLGRYLRRAREGAGAGTSARPARGGA